MATTGGWRNLVHRGVPPRSLAAVALVVGSIGLATVVRYGFGSIGRGVVLPYATYFPAVLISGLLAGPIAGAAAAILSVLVISAALAWPQDGFEVPPTTDLLGHAMFLASSALVIWLAEHYRRAVRQLDAREAARELIVREFQHRLKNTLTVMQSIILQSLPDDKSRATDIISRIQAVSSTDDLVAQSGANSVDLRTLIESKFDSFRARTACAGPPVDLSPEVARGIALIVHELVTNAIKHGGLSRPGGRIDVSWRLSEEHVHLVWSETGGPPAVMPAEFGFGTRLVIRTLRTLDGSIEPEFLDTGLSCTIRFPAST